MKEYTVYVTDKVPKGKFLGTLLFSLNEKYQLLSDLYDQEKVDILINHSSENDLSREDKLFQYATIVTLTESTNLDKHVIRKNRSDSYVQTCSTSEADNVSDSLKSKPTINVYNSEAFKLFSNEDEAKCVQVIMQQIEDKLNRHYISVIPDQSPKKIEQVLTDKDKLELFEYVTEFDSMSLPTKNRPTNHFSKLVVYKNNLPTQVNNELVTYVDNVNGVIRYSAKKQDYSSKVSLDIVAHHAIHEALFSVAESLVIFNRYNKSMQTYNSLDNNVIAIPLPLNSIDYYVELLNRVRDSWNGNSITILVPNRGTFTIIPLSLGNFEIMKLAKQLKRTRTHLRT